jgi:hypothetical protein
MILTCKKAEFTKYIQKYASLQPCKSFELTLFFGHVVLRFNCSWKAWVALYDCSVIYMQNYILKFNLSKT